MLLAASLAFILTGAYCLTRLLMRPNVSLAAKRVDSIVSANLEAANIKSSQIQKNYVPKKNGGVNWEQIEVVVAVDDSQSLNALKKTLQRSLNKPVFAVKESKKEEGASHEEIRFSVYYDRLPVYQMLLQQKRIASIPKGLWREERPKVALIVDDVGYDKKRALELLELRRPMTIAVFPQLRYSRKIAQTAHSMGYEVMMHLPMEPDETLARNPGIITTGMGEQELYSMMDADFGSIPYVAGVNNHQGSKMTRNPEAMSNVMRYLAGKNIFFIDSRTASDSVAYKVGKEFGLRAAENDLFLDNEKDVEYIKERIHLLIEEANRKGQAIGICHVHPATIQALKEMFPIVDKEGIELVYASELAK